MARTKKDFLAKRSDILNKVWTLFLTRGYEHTTLAVILKELELSKGVFYHYFGSKEECANAAVDLYSDMILETLMAHCRALGYETQHPLQKLKTLFKEGQMLAIENPLALEGINARSNQVFHTMLMVSLTKKLSLQFAAVIREGVEQNCFHTDYPLQLAEMILTLSHFYLDADFFAWKEDTLHNKVEAYKTLIAKGLGIEPRAIFEKEPETQVSTI